MPCGTCAARAASIANNKQSVSASHKMSAQSGPCEYSVEMLQDFNKKLVWFKDRALYRKHKILPRTMNKYIGIVLSALNVPNRCTYKEELDTISDLVDLIITIQNA